MADQKAWGAALYTIKHENGERLEIGVSGRDRWALEALIAAGALGCTPIETPCPRWSAYVHNLRNLGVPIETITERHDGPFAGTHARYVLRASVTLSEGADA
jgi:hypothetical protein